MTEAEFDGFYAAAFGRLVSQVYAMCGNLPESQDCVQEAFIRAWDHRGALDRDRAPEAWVRTTAYRLAVSRWRRHRRVTASEAEPPAAPGADRAATDRVAVRAALERLPREQRRVVVLHHLCDLSVAEIADEIGAPTGTVKARLSRARVAMAPWLTDILEEQHHGR